MRDYCKSVDQSILKFYSKQVGKNELVNVILGLEQVNYRSMISQINMNSGDEG